RPGHGWAGGDCRQLYRHRGFRTRTGELGLPGRHRWRDKHAWPSIWHDRKSSCTPSPRCVGVCRARGGTALGMLGRRPLRAGTRAEHAMIAERMIRLCVAGVLAFFPAWFAPPAAAVNPPVVDDSMLPTPGPPAPPRPTKQQDRCVTTTPAKADTADAGQLGGLNLQQVWKFTRGAGQTVAVIDTGVARHRLLPHLVPGGDYVSTADGTEDCDGHGTVVAGIIGAAPDSDRSAFSGIAPDATIVSMRQSSSKFRAIDDPSGSGFGDVDTLAS